MDIISCIQFLDLRIRDTEDPDMRCDHWLWKLRTQAMEVASFVCEVATQRSTRRRSCSAHRAWGVNMGNHLPDTCSSAPCQARDLPRPLLVLFEATIPRIVNGVKCSGTLTVKQKNKAWPESETDILQHVVVFFLIWLSLFNKSKRTHASCHHDLSPG